MLLGENDREKRKRIPNDVEEKKPVRGGHWAFSIDNLLSHALDKTLNIELPCILSSPNVHYDPPPHLPKTRVVVSNQYLE